LLDYDVISMLMLSLLFRVDLGTMWLFWSWIYTNCDSFLLCTQDVWWNT